MKTQQHLNAIIGRYGSFDNLKKSCNWYKKNYNDIYKQYRSDCRNVYHLKQKIKQFDEGKGQERDVIKKNRINIVEK